MQPQCSGPHQRQDWELEEQPRIYCKHIRVVVFAIGTDILRQQLVGSEQVAAYACITGYCVDGEDLYRARSDYVVRVKAKNMHRNQTAEPWHQD
jgi:hypothetical protein